MTVMLGYETLRGALSMRETIDLLERAFANEAVGATVVSPKYVTNFQHFYSRCLCQ